MSVTLDKLDTFTAGSELLVAPLPSRPPAPRPKHFTPPETSAQVWSQPPTTFVAPSKALVVLTGLRKPWRTSFDERDYRAVRALGEDHRSSFPRRIAE